MKYLALLLALVAVPLWAQTPTKGFFLTPAEIASLPQSGPAWKYLQDKAGATYDPDLSDQNSEANVRVLAGAIVAVATQDSALRDRVRAAVINSVGTEGADTLALGRELGAYVVAADLVGLPADLEQAYKLYLRGLMRKTISNKTLISTHEIRPNNWGTVAGWSRLCCDLYLRGSNIVTSGGINIGLEAEADLQKAARVFQGWLGERAVYAGFKYGDLDWQCAPNLPVGINPVGCTIQGHPMDGGLPEELRRAGSFRWPPPKENYCYTSMEGVVLQSWLLHRAGFPAWTWSQNAVGRAIEWLNVTADFPAVGNDVWMISVLNKVYNTNYRITASPAPLSRAIIGGDWWYPAVNGGGTLPPPDPVPFDKCWHFAYDSDAKVWRATQYGSNPGTGLTPAAALSNWIVVNPGKP